MQKKTGLITLVLLTAMPSIASAGGNLSWIDSVTVSVSHNDMTGQIDTYVSSSPTTGGGSFGVADLFQPRAGEGSQYSAIIDFQGTANSINLVVSYASWNFNVANGGGSVPLDVYSFPSSPSPPQIDTVPSGTFLYELAIPVGDYTSSPYALTLYGNNAGGGTALLLETVSSTLFGSPSISFDAPSAGGVGSSTSVPEPSSWVMLGTAMTAMIVLARRKRNS
jgi:hypothetical protein